MATPAAKNTSKKAGTAKAGGPAVATSTSTVRDEDMDRIVMAYLTKKGYANAQSALRKDSRHAATLDQVTFDNIAEAEASVSNYVLFYNSSENNSRHYEESYTEIKHWIEGALENFRAELSKILFPLFVHSYLNLINRGFMEEARQFMQRYRGDHAKAHADTLQKLANVTLPQHIKENEAAVNLRTQRLNLEMSQSSFDLLIEHLQQKGQMLMLGIINQYLHIHVIKGNPNSDDDALTSKMIMTGERLEEVDEVNHKDVMWGLLDEHPEVRKLDEQAAQEDREAQRQKQQQQQPKKKVKFQGDRQNMQRGKPGDIQVKPPRDRLPYPEMSDEDIAMRLQVLKELRQAVTLGPTSLPSVCMYTMLNTQQGLNSITFSDNVKMMANGFQDSSVRVWSLTGEKLRVMKEGAVLREMLNEGVEAEAFTSEMLLDPSTGSNYKTLLGHSGPVYNTSFSPDNRFLLSCSEDSTIRLWSLQTYTNLVCYKGHNYPVWDVQFSPLGYYFVSGSYDRTARVWSTDQVYPVRIFAGHMGDVDCVGFHPNANYVASGSSDKTCRLWDLLHKNGCVRLFADHKAPVTCIATSPCGRFLASAGEDKSVVVWDIGEGRKVGTLLGHDSVVYSLAFSVDSSVLASGSGDNTVRLWDVKTMQTDKNSPSLQLLALPTKSTPVTSVKFTRQNLLVAGGPFTPV